MSGHPEMRSLDRTERANIRDALLVLAAQHGTQAKAAAAIKCSSTRFGEHAREAASWTVSEELLAKFAAGAGVSVEALLRGEGPRPEGERRRTVRTVGRSGGARI
jgi:hypothetical protein